MVEQQLKELSLEDVHIISKKLIFEDAILKLNKLKRKYQLSGDKISNERILLTISELYFQNKKFSELKEFLAETCLTNKHLQSNIIIQKCCDYIPLIEDKNEKLEFLKTLKAVTEDKLFLEPQRAKICLSLVKIQREEYDIAGALDTIENLKINSITTIDEKEKIEILLELMWLLLESKDIDKCHLVANNIMMQKFDTTPESEELKIRFYEMLVAMDKNDNYLNVSKHYQAMLEIKNLCLEIDNRRKTLKLAIIYCILAPFHIEKSVMMEKLYNHKFISEVPKYKELLNQFIIVEIINWYSMKAKFKDSFLSLGIFDLTNQDDLKRWKDLRTVTIEHNIKVFATYYQRMYISHISDFLDISINESEKFLCNLIFNKTIYAKIDRVSGIVTFQHIKTRRNKENYNFMKLIDDTIHLIYKEIITLNMA